MELQTQVLMLFNHLDWVEKKITYSNGEVLINKEATFNDIKIIVSNEIVSTEHIMNSGTYRIHKNLCDLVKEVEEKRQPLFSFFMF